MKAVGHSEVDERVPRTCANVKEMTWNTLSRLYIFAKSSLQLSSSFVKVWRNDFISFYNTRCMMSCDGHHLIVRRVITGWMLKSIHYEYYWILLNTSIIYDIAPQIVFAVNVLKRVWLPLTPKTKQASISFYCIFLLSTPLFLKRIWLPPDTQNK